MLSLLASAYIKLIVIKIKLKVQITPPTNSIVKVYKFSALTPSEAMKIGATIVVIRPLKLSYGKIPLLWEFENESSFCSAKNFAKKNNSCHFE